MSSTDKLIAIIVVVMGLVGFGNAFMKSYSQPVKELKDRLEKVELRLEKLEALKRDIAI